ncbi:MAG: hypothetical protein WBA43_07385 [Elainellaceae cyanobacterium]
MNYLSDWISRLRLMRVLFSALLLVAIAFTTALPAFAARRMPNEGTVQLDEITRKSEATADTPSMEMNPIDKPTERGLNEVQGTADRDKMFSSDDTQLPVIKQIENALKK